MNQNVVMQNQGVSGAQQIPSSAQASSSGGIVGLGGLKKKPARQDEVNDAFYEQFVYENLEQIIRKYQLLQKDKNDQELAEKKLIEEEE